MSAVRENWRIVMLSVFLIVSAGLLFAPMIGDAFSSTSSTVSVSGSQTAIDATDSTLNIDSAVVEVVESGPIEVNDSSITVSGSETDVSSGNVTVSDGTVNVTGGTVMVPSSTGIAASGNGTANATAQLDSTTVRTTNSEVDVVVSRPKWTNLNYGLDLDGGTRVRAPLVGMYAENVSLGGAGASTVDSQLADALGADDIDVNIVTRPGSTADIEVYLENLTRSEFQTGLEDVGLSVTDDQINDGVTAETRQTVVETLSQKINRGGLSGGTVSQLSGGEENFIVVEVPGASRSNVIDTVSERGLVEIVGQVRNENGTVTANETVLIGDEITVGQIGTREGGNWEVGITVNSDQAAQDFSTSMQELGFTSSVGRTNCDRGGEVGKPGSYCLLTVLNGEVVYDNGMGSLADSINDGSFVDQPTFSIGAPDQETAQQVRVNLQVGALPTRLDIDDGTSYFVSPSLAQEFKLFALLTGLIAWIGVSAMVFLRYKRVRVAVPMLFTAIAEVFILLGFAVAVGLPLDLSHIAGFIAVIGTGVDDLVIIADEILQQGNVATGRVFQSRFRKAFWVIGAAAATTIIAMSPLTVLSLGDLTGFAIVTIVGVLIGVLITRPAYGDILRNLVLGDEELNA